MATKPPMTMEAIESFVFASPGDGIERMVRRGELFAPDSEAVKTHPHWFVRMDTPTHDRPHPRDVIAA